MRYSEKLLAHFYRPCNVGVLENARCATVGVPQHGEVVTVYLSIDQTDVISDARFLAQGSPPVIACCSFITEWLKGKTQRGAQALDEQLLMDYFALPLVKRHCVLLVVDAVHACLR